MSAKETCNGMLIHVQGRFGTGQELLGVDQPFATECLGSASTNQSVADEAMPCPALGDLPDPLDRHRGA